MKQSQSLTIVIVDKTGTLKSLNVKEYKEEELFKKCGFKKVDPCMKKRMNDLQNEIDKQVERINAEENTELLELHYLFYDGYH